MSLAAETREAVRDRPFLFEALRAGVVNYTAAARTLDVEGDAEAIATALRRYADELDPVDRGADDVRVAMEGGIREVGPSGEGAESADPLLAVGGRAFAADGGSLTAIVGRGDVDAATLRAVLGRLATAEVSVEAAGVSDEALVVVVERRAGADALRAVESAVEG